MANSDHLAQYLLGPSTMLQMTRFYSSLWLNNIPLCIFFILTIVNNAAMNMECRYLLELVLLFSSEKYPEVEFLGCMVVLFLIF